MERTEKAYIVIKVHNIVPEPKIYTRGFFNREDAVKYIQEEWEEMFNHFLALHNMFQGTSYFPNIDMREDRTFHEEDFAKITLEDECTDVSFYLREVNF